MFRKIEKEDIITEKPEENDNNVGTIKSKENFVDKFSRIVRDYNKTDTAFKLLNYSESKEQIKEINTKDELREVKPKEETPMISQEQIAVLYRNFKNCKPKIVIGPSAIHRNGLFSCVK